MKIVCALEKKTTDIGMQWTVWHYSSIYHLKKALNVSKSIGCNILLIQK